MTQQPGSHTIAIHILFKLRQPMIFGQVIEYNKRNVFLRKPCTAWDRETSSSGTEVN